jgi:predicted PurR-regulated permease PerM
MTTREQVRFWLVGFVAALVAIYLLRGMLLPFVAGMAVAYLLDPICDRIESWGLSRALATTLVTASFVLLAAGALILLLPLMLGEVARLAEHLPDYVAAVQARALPLLDLLSQRLGAEASGQVRGAIGGQVGQIAGWIAGAMGQVVSGGLAVVNALSLVLITPVVAFYLLRDWDGIVRRLDHWLPRRQAAVIREQLARIDETLAGYARGQATVCLLLAVYYGAALALVGLDFGLVVGIATGILAFVPFVGALSGLAVALGLAVAQSGGWLPVLPVLAVFAAGQAIEGYVLTPKLVGERVGLHPVWVIFSLLAGGSLFGFVGVLLGLPAAAVIGVLTRFSLGRYLASRYYDPDQGAGV